MKITLRCLPELEAHLPKPVLARNNLPDWLRRMPASAHSAFLDQEVRTVKQCPPFLDAMSQGLLMPLACDVTIADGRFSWDWDLPVLETGRDTRSPLGVHMPEQAAGAPLALDSGHAVIKFNSFWTIGLPEGWSMLFTHPFNREELPFRTLTGVVDCDSFSGGLVHFPAVWRQPGFEGVLPQGIPVAQCIPLPREALTLDIAGMDDAERQAHETTQEQLRKAPGAYRKGFRRAGDRND